MKVNFLKKLSKEKQKELAVVILVTVAVLFGLGYGLIRHQYGVLAEQEKRREDANQRLEQMHNMVRRAALTESELAAASAKLSAIEETMSTHDIYAWFISTLRPFKDTHKIEFQQYRTALSSGISLLPKYPYKQATLSVEGVARYYDLGRFLADFENQFPYVRLINIEIEPASGASEVGQLSFKMDVVTLIRPTSS